MFTNEPSAVFVVELASGAFCSAGLLIVAEFTIILFLLLHDRVEFAYVMAIAALVTAFAQNAIRASWYDGFMRTCLFA